MPAYPLHNILFLDIETVSQYDSFEKVPPEGRELWARKAEFLIKDRPAETVESVYSRAGIYAEFGKIICISCGVISESGADKKLILKSFSGDEEREILLEFCEMLAKWTPGPTKYLCAHNGKEFDFPYLCRKLLIHGLPIPSILQLSGKKPWEIPHLDTMELWRFGEYKNYTSLSLLSYVLGIATPKDDIDGSMVGDVYWRQKDLPRIVSYCQKDVIALAQVYLRLQGESIIGPGNIKIK